MMAAGNGAASSARFDFSTSGRIVFGAGTARDLPAIVAGLGKRAMWVAGSRPERHAALRAALAEQVEAIETFSVKGEPTVAVAEAGARLCRDAACDIVVGVGGGSVLDAAKAIAALAANDGPALDYLEVVGRGLPLARPALPFVAVPTTAGTGSEVTRNAVLAVTEARVKVSLRHASMLPCVAVVDPDLAIDLPLGPTAATSLDALTQLIEPFLSVRANPMTDALCRDGIPRAARALYRLADDLHDRAARADMALAALYSGMALANAGLGAVHGFAGPLGGSYPAPHGAVCAALLPHVLAGNHAAIQARAPNQSVLSRFDEVARLLTGRTDATAVDAAAWCAETVRRLGVPALGTWGIQVEHVPVIAAQAAKASSMKGNPVVLTSTELESILFAALAA